MVSGMAVWGYDKLQFVFGRRKVNFTVRNKRFLNDDFIQYGKIITLKNG